MVLCTNRHFDARASAENPTNISIRRPKKGFERYSDVIACATIGYVCIRRPKKGFERYSDVIACATIGYMSVYHRRLNLIGTACEIFK
jgi:hypothetical protein